MQLVSCLEEGRGTDGDDALIKTRYDDDDVVQGGVLVFLTRKFLAHLSS